MGGGAEADLRNERGQLVAFPAASAASRASASRMAWTWQTSPASGWPPAVCTSATFACVSASASSRPGWVPPTPATSFRAAGSRLGLEEGGAGAFLLVAQPGGCTERLDAPCPHDAVLQGLAAAQQVLLGGEVMTSTGVAPRAASHAASAAAAVPWVAASPARHPSPAPEAPAAPLAPATGTMAPLLPPPETRARDERTLIILSPTPCSAASRVASCALEE
jgi:hypothetical protein